MGVWAGEGGTGVCWFGWYLHHITSVGVEKRSSLSSLEGHLNKTSGGEGGGLGAGDADGEGREGLHIRQRSHDKLPKYEVVKLQK